MGLDGFVFLSFPWKLTTKGNGFGSFLNHLASWGLNFIQHRTPCVEIFCFLVSCDVQSNLDRLVVTLTRCLNICRNSAMSREQFCHRKVSSKDGVCLSSSCNLQFLYMFVATTKKIYAGA